ncbi:perlucin-like [Mizuhopecten yessoensis]|uniref:Perlucin n=1 Tax=Mizuhopecten yessoensis TaxID=6573 RepID=A0A210Q9H9_MIZYE|nr:perlucin-like [Mizuhopecten yessoensis]OWF45339.1 Perlucin [Mizuhopecten yessoensis]
MAAVSMYEIFCVLLVLTVTTQVSGDCPSGFLVHANSCYMDFNIQATWAEASMICDVYGGYLAEIGDEHEQHFIAGYISRKTKSSYKPGIFWLGASDLLTEGEWMWSNSDTYLTYKNFAPGEPNNAAGGEHCLEFDFSGNFQWNDNNCENLYNFVCEVPMKISTGGIIG